MGYCFVCQSELMWALHYYPVNFFLGTIAASLGRETSSCILQYCFICGLVDCQPRQAHVVLMLSRWWKFSWKKNFPSWVDQYYCGTCSSWRLWSFCQFFLCKKLVVAPVTFLFVDNTGVFIILQSSPGGGGETHSCWFFSAWNLPSVLRLRISSVFHYCAQMATPTPLLKFCLPKLSLLHWCDIPSLPQVLDYQWPYTHWSNPPPPPQCLYSA